MSIELGRVSKRPRTQSQLELRLYCRQSLCSVVAAPIGIPKGARSCGE